MDSRTKHGHAKKHDGTPPSRTYRIWLGMKTRCQKPNHTHYDDYGGRGIKVCERWLNSFENFLEDVGEIPKGLTLDRIDNDGNYEPSNCRLATAVEQSNNKRNNRLVEFNGKRQSVSQWGKELGIHKHTLRDRLNHGWPIEEALRADNIQSHNGIEFNGERKTINEWAQSIGISRESMRDRLKNWPLEKALTTPRRKW